MVAGSPRVVGSFSYDDCVRLSLTGTNFGVSGTITLGGAACPPFNGGYSHSLIQCLVPAGSGLSQPVVVTAGGVSSAPVSFSYAAPTLSAVTPALGPVTG